MTKGHEDITIPFAKTLEDRPDANILTKRRNTSLVCDKGMKNRYGENFREGFKFLVTLFIHRRSLGLYKNIRISFEIFRSLRDF